ncbi:hypothetical protein ACTXT7_015117 [Hymenolepis weldensis]
MRADIPAPPEDTQKDGCWLSMHSRFLTQGRDKEPEVLFLGDSILFNFEATKIYKTYVEPLHCLNFSIPNDETQNILWRVLNGELDDVKVKVVVLSVGTHNKCPAEEVVIGINAILKVIKQRQPDAHIVVMFILVMPYKYYGFGELYRLNIVAQATSSNNSRSFLCVNTVTSKFEGSSCQWAIVTFRRLPFYKFLRGLLPCGKTPNPRRQKHAEINKLLSAQFSHPGDRVVFLCPDWEALLQSDKSITHRDMMDYLHPTEDGYEKFIEPLVEELQTSLQTFLKTNAPSSSPL